MKSEKTSAAAARMRLRARPIASLQVCTLSKSTTLSAQGTTIYGVDQRDVVIDGETYVRCANFDVMRVDQEVSLGTVFDKWPEWWCVTPLKGFSVRLRCRGPAVLATRSSGVITGASLNVSGLVAISFSGSFTLTKVNATHDSLKASPAIAIPGLYVGAGQKLASFPAPAGFTTMLDVASTLGGAGVPTYTVFRFTPPQGISPSVANSQFMSPLFLALEVTVQGVTYQLKVGDLSGAAGNGWAAFTVVVACNETTTKIGYWSPDSEQPGTDAATFRYWSIQSTTYRMGRFIALPAPQGGGMIPAGVSSNSLAGGGAGGTSAPASVVFVPSNGA